MNFGTLKDLVTSKMARQILHAQKHSPKILFVVGAVGVVGATVLACRATLKMDEVLDEYEMNIEKTQENHPATTARPEDLNRDINKLKLKTGLEITKLYAPAVGLGVVSIAALTGSHVILTKRNTAVMAAYAGMQKAYDEYRKRVRDEYGVEVDAKFGVGATDRMVEEQTIDGKKTTNHAELAGKFGGSPYAVVFDENSKFFTKEPGMNPQIVMMKQSYANDKLHANGHLFLNEVYDMLGLPRTKAGAVVGWVYRKDNQEKTGDNYVSFGVFDGEPEWVEAFVDGVEKYAVLDFNVDGVILDLI